MIVERRRPRLRNFLVYTNPKNCSSDPSHSRDTPILKASHAHRKVFR